MKRAIYITLLGFVLTFQLSAQQKIIEKNFPLPRGKKVNLNLKFGQHITVQTWDKSEVAFKAVIDYQLEGLKEAHTIDIDDNSNELRIATDYDLKGKKDIWRDCNQQQQYFGPGSYCLRVNYEIILPKAAIARLETISGNIEIKDFKGDLRAKSISGFVDLALPANHSTELKFKSVTGEIYTDFDIELDKRSTAYSKKVATSLNGGGSNLLALETVSGDIFFRKL